ncbi:DUF1302 family protein [Candidatus Omnitrophota bacterium]
MKKVILFSGLLLFALVVLPVRIGFAEPVANLIGKVNPFDKLELAGYFSNESSLKLGGEMADWMKLKNIVDVKSNYVFTDNIEFYTEMKWWYDHTYDIEGRYNNLTNNEQNKNLTMPVKGEWLRECYFDIFTPRLDLRLGKQQVVWGTADGVRILDMVNPLDYREWTLKSYDEIRMPLWMLKLEGELMANGHLQFLAIPDYQPNYYAPAGSPFALRTVILGAESAAAAASNPFVTIHSIEDRPERTLENTKIGLRWRNVIEEGLLSGLEYTLNYLHTWDFASAAYTGLAAGPGGANIYLTRRSEQIEVLGFSFAKSITKGILGTSFGKGWTVRGEFAYVKNGAMNYGVDKDIKGTVDVDQYNWVLGFDKTFWTSWDFSMQFIQMIANAKEEFNRTAANYTLLFGPTRGPLDKTSNMITCRVATSFNHDRVMPEILVLYGDDNDWRISPKVKLEINDNWMVATGFHFFEGDDPGLNGQFDKNDQFFLENKYSW